MMMMMIIMVMTPKEVTRVIIGGCIQGIRGLGGIIATFPLGRNELGSLDYLRLASHVARQYRVAEVNIVRCDSLCIV